MKAEGLRLSVGMKLYLQHLRPDGITEVLHCSLIGFVEGQGLNVRPQDEAAFSTLSKGEWLTTRMAVDERRYAFACEVLTLVRQPYLHIHLSYPEEIQGIFKRVAPRYRIHKPIRLSLHLGDEQVKVAISDISNSGACLLADVPLGVNSDTLNIEFRVPFDQSLITLPCSVRYVLAEQDEGGSQYRHGVAFQFSSTEEQCEVEQFIALLVNKQYAQPSTESSWA